LNNEQVEELAQLGAHQRASDEGREGLNARLDKRKPRWAPQG
jgi:enoyl-CoA hydratase/carnithine racemase